MSSSVMSVGEGNKMPMINEDAVMDDSTVSGSVNDSDQINDMLDEALDVSVSPSRSMASTSRLVSPTRSSAARLASAPSPSRASAKSPKRSPNRSPNRLLRNSPIRHSAGGGSLTQFYSLCSSCGTNDANFPLLESYPFTLPTFNQAGGRKAFLSYWRPSLLEGHWILSSIQLLKNL